MSEGDPCPSCCQGVMEYQTDGDCSCHINPPCSSCTDSVLRCSQCDYEPVE
jgi:hypothetical protein